VLGLLSLVAFHMIEWACRKCSVIKESETTPFECGCGAAGYDNWISRGPAEEPANPDPQGVYTLNRSDWIFLKALRIDPQQPIPEKV
jgi:hypothetical protein